MVAVDCFSKWCEIGVLQTHGSRAVWEWFYATIICRYGVPFVIRSDQGREYAGEFDQECSSWGI